MPRTSQSSTKKHQENPSPENSHKISGWPQPHKKVVEQKGSTEASLTDAPSLFGMEVDMEKIIKQME